MLPPPEIPKEILDFIEKQDKFFTELISESALLYGGEKDKMPDKLNELFNKYAETTPEASFNSFQAGFTASAVSMRQRALELVQKAKITGKVIDLKNDLINAIGSLPDIPKE